jgi:hypothetical protein
MLRDGDAETRKDGLSALAGLGDDVASPPHDEVEARGQTFEAAARVAKGGILLSVHCDDSDWKKEFELD